MTVDEFADRLVAEARAPSSDRAPPGGGAAVRVLGGAGAVPH